MVVRYCTCASGTFGTASVATSRINTKDEKAIPRCGLVHVVWFSSPHNPGVAVSLAYKCTHIDVHTYIRGGRERELLQSTHILGCMKIPHYND